LNSLRAVPQPKKRDLRGGAPDLTRGPGLRDFCEYEMISQWRWLGEEKKKKMEIEDRMAGKGTWGKRSDRGTGKKGKESVGGECYAFPRVACGSGETSRQDRKRGKRKNTGEGERIDLRTCCQPTGKD